MALSPEMTQKVHEWRQKALQGTLTMDECKEALAALRSSRTQAQLTSTASKTKKASAKQKIDADDLLSQLEGL